MNTFQTLAICGMAFYGNVLEIDGNNRSTKSKARNFSLAHFIHFSDKIQMKLKQRVEMAMVLPNRK